MYAGVILEDGGKVWSVLNVRGLAIPEFTGRVAEPVVYEGETPEARIARRKAKWTPTEIDVADGRVRFAVGREARNPTPQRSFNVCWVTRYRSNPTYD